MTILQRMLRLLPLALGLAALAIAIASQASVFHVQDDAYMYARYADNLRHGDGLAWNPGGEPTFGATALLYVPWVAAVATLFSDSPGQTIILASTLGMCAAFGLVALLFARALAGATGLRSLVLAICAATAACSYRQIAGNATNGMDTGFSMACLALLLFAWWRWAADADSTATGSGASARGARFCVVLASWLVFTARPDLGLYALGIPAVQACVLPGRRRLECAQILAGAGAAILMTIAWLWWYFGSPLPLSFYIKTLATSFGAPFLERHGPEAREQFEGFLVLWSPLWIFVALDLASRWRARGELSNALWLAILAPTLLHWTYYRFEVLQLIAFHQRFYYPTLPALLFLGATSMARVLAIVHERIQSKKHATLAAGACFLACGLASAYSLRSAWSMWRSESKNHKLAQFDIQARYATQRARNNWFALDGFSLLGDDLAIATTEIGLPSAMNPHKRMIDLVGLNENGFARRGFDAHRLCAELQPDVLYMPHPDYTTMIEAITKDATFQSDYVLMTAEELGAFMGLALRRASPHFAKLNEIVVRRRAEVPGPKERDK